MKLKVIQTDITTSIYDGNLEVCKFVTGSRLINKKYAKEIISKVSKTQQLIEDYERRLNTVLEEIKGLKLTEELKEERLSAKASCYRTFIAELRTK